MQFSKKKRKEKKKPRFCVAPQIKAKLIKLTDCFNIYVFFSKISANIMRVELLYTNFNGFLLVNLDGERLTDLENCGQIAKISLIIRGNICRFL